MSTAPSFAPPADQPAEPAALALFLARFSWFCVQAREGDEGKVSRALFGHNSRIEQIRAGSDIGVRRLERADKALAEMAAANGVTLPDAVDKSDSETGADRKPAMAAERAAGGARA